MAQRDRPQNPKEANQRLVNALMRRGEAFEDTVMKDPSGDSRRRGGLPTGAHLAPPPVRRVHFTSSQVDRYYLVGCSPYTFLQGTRSELLPPLTRDGYRLERDPGLKEQWDELSQEEKDAYGFERETQDVLQALVESCDAKIASEEAALKEVHPLATPLSYTP